ncbi:hypothetical protein C8R45DRAFT_1114513 [Mycena sanguinolenta]|nr:hypothetical protein C8R45DRAFT_1114513 [Mycena sanguinolenta]
MSTDFLRPSARLFFGRRVAPERDRARRYPAWTHLPALTIVFLGVQTFEFSSVEMAYASQYVLSLGHSTSHVGAVQAVDRALLVDTLPPEQQAAGKSRRFRCAPESESTLAPPVPPRRLGAPGALLRFAAALTASTRMLTDIPSTAKPSLRDEPRWICTHACTRLLTAD